MACGDFSREVFGHKLSFHLTGGLKRLFPFSPFFTQNTQNLCDFQAVAPIDYLYADLDVN